MSLLAWIMCSMVGLVACGGEPEQVEGAVPAIQAGHVATRIFGGERDHDAASGVVALRVGEGSSFELCTGALIAPNMVLTARHCLSKMLTPTIVCDQNGASGSGDQVASDVDPASVSVYTTGKPSFAKAGNARGKAIVHGEGAVLCDRDIAVLVLDRNIDDIPVLPVRVGSPLRAGETMRSVGYGRNDQSLPTGTRVLRGNVPVLAVGKGVSASRTPLGAHEFEVGLSTCQGDSGGPAISEQTGEVFGVVSRAGECTDDFGHVYTSTAGQQELLAKAFAAAGQKASFTLPASREAPAEAPAAVAPAQAGGCSTSGNAPVDGLGLAGIALGVATLLRRRAS